MGERFQFYVKYKNKNGDNRYVAIHDQWCYGDEIIQSVMYLIEWIKENPPSSLFLESDYNEFVKSVLTCRIVEGERRYKRVYVEEMYYTPEKADSNHGCAIIDVTDERDIKYAIYDVDKKLVEKSMNLENAEELYSNTCKEMMKLYELSIVNKV